MASNDEYWKNRAAQEMYEDMAEAEETAETVAKVYLKASRYIEGQLEDIFDTYRRRHGLSASQAYLLIRRMKNKSDLEELVRLLQNSIDAGDKQEKERLIAELESAAYRARIEHFARLQSQIDEMMQNVYKQEKTANQKLYESLAQDSYYRSIFDIQQRCGVGFSFNHIDPKQIEHVLSRPWSGKHYSKRIWDNTQALAEQVQEEILLSLMTGKTEREAAESVNAVFAKGSAVARRLIRTESNYVTTELNFKAYEEAGIKEYQYLATLDLKTSEICRSLDGKIFKVSEHQVGVNCPPMHPWCRSTTISVVDRAYISKMKRSAIDPATGEKILVPRSMNYAEWYAKYVDGRENATAKPEKAQTVQENVPESHFFGKPLDITVDWKNKTRNAGSVSDLMEYTVDGELYHVDNDKIILNYSGHEKQIAEVIARKAGKQVQMVPKINYPQGIQTPDYLINGARFDLKTPEGNGKNTLYGMVKSKKRQANNFVICADKTPLELNELIRQIEDIYLSKHTAFVDNIVLVKDMEIVKVYKRNK